MPLHPISFYVSFIFLIPSATKNLTSTFDIPCSIFDILTRHCEERSDAAISSLVIPSAPVLSKAEGVEESIKNAIASIAKQSQNQIINNQ